jgi:asparagine synthase (glutamine-hydrolysing)
MQSADASTHTTSSFRRHGIQGWSKFGAGENSSGNIQSTPFETTLELARTSNPSFEALATGDLYEDTCGTAVAVAGTPYFDTPKYSDIQRSQGVAAAIAQAYTDHERDVFKHIRGTFCCCIIDTTHKRLLAGIDRLGHHSLYYSIEDELIRFASEARGALDPAPGKTALHKQGLYNYVYFHMVPSPGTIFQSVNKLPAAHFLEFQHGEGQVHNYWLPEFSTSSKARDPGALAQELKEVLRDSVRSCIPEQGKTGAFLSGGLDSSTVTGMMSEVYANDASGKGEAFAIGFAADGYDEMAYARISAKHFGVKLNEYYVTPQDVVKALPLIATSYEEPFGNSSALPAYFCARMAAESGVTTLLAGDGGDEIFAGNERYLRQRVFDHYQLVPRLLRQGIIEPLVKALPDSFFLASKARSYIEQANTPLPDRLQSYNFLHRHAASEIFCTEFLEGIDTELPLDIQREVYQRPGNTSDLDRMLYFDWQYTLADNDLRKVSHMCALAGVDVTYPMLTDQLVDFSCRVPTNIKIQGNDLRFFFKRSLEDWLPHETIHKTKQGFGLPFGVWMQTYTPLKELAYDSLLKLKHRGFIRPDFIDRAIEMHQSEHAAYYGELVWILTVFELWIDAKTNAGVDVWKQ